MYITNDWELEDIWLHFSKKIGAKTEARSASMLTYVRTVSLLIIKLVVTTTLYSELGLEPIRPNRDDKKFTNS